MKEFLEILIEVVKLLDRLLDLDEKELDLCSRALHSYIIDFRNAMARFANRLQRKSAREEQKQEKISAALYAIEDEEDIDDDSADDYADASLYIRRAKRMDRELG